MTYLSSQSYRTLTHWQSGGGFSVLDAIWEGLNFQAVLLNGVYYHNFSNWHPASFTPQQFYFDTGEAAATGFGVKLDTSKLLSGGQADSDDGINHVYGAVYDLGALDQSTYYATYSSLTGGDVFVRSAHLKDDGTPEATYFSLNYNSDSKLYYAPCCIPKIHSYLISFGYRPKDSTAYDTKIPAYLLNVENDSKYSEIWADTLSLIMGKNATIEYGVELSPGTLGSTLESFFDSVLDIGGKSIAGGQFSAPSGAKFVTAEKGEPLFGGNSRIYFGGFNTLSTPVTTSTSVSDLVAAMPKDPDMYYSAGMYSLAMDTDSSGRKLLYAYNASCAGGGAAYGLMSGVQAPSRKLQVVVQTKYTPNTQLKSTAPGFSFGFDATSESSPWGWGSYVVNVITGVRLEVLPVLKAGGAT